MVYKGTAQPCLTCHAFDKLCSMSRLKALKDLHRVWPFVDDIPVEGQNVGALAKLTLS